MLLLICAALAVDTGCDGINVREYYQSCSKSLGFSGILFPPHPDLFDKKVNSITASTNALDTLL